MLFAPPPPSWFAEPDVVGVDWEGTPPRLVQVACRRGVAVDVAGAPWAAAVLRDARHAHVVFGAHEVALVAAGAAIDAQRGDPSLSLAETFSRACCPDVRLTKDPTLHARTDWAAAARARRLPREAALYAALDAWATRLAAGRGARRRRGARVVSAGRERGS